MAKVQHFLPETTPKFICSKGDLHAEEPLNLVCLDPLCRNDPLGCATCFAQIHKYHRVVSLDKFLDDYARNVRQGSSGRAARRIEKHHKQVRELITKLRESVNQQLDDFEDSIDTYAEELKNKTTMRQRLSKQMRVNLQPKQGGSNKEELGSLVRIVLDNSFFDKGNNMVRVAEVLKQDEQKIQALLDRMFNMTQFCQEYVQQVMKSFHFADETIKQQHLSHIKDLTQLKTTKDQFDAEQFIARQKERTTLTNSVELPKEHWLKQSTTSTAFQPAKESPKKTKRQEDPKLVFHPQYKHSMIEIREKGTAGVSNVTALKPQYAFIAPHLGIKPQQVREWSLQVKSCRNFASQNTLAIGLSPLEELKQSNFQGYYPKEAVLLTSQGYLLQGGNSRKTELIFSAGDILHCKYDPFYSLFEISKQNGRKLSLTVPTPPNRQLFGCVRLTYASDQIQIL